MKNKQGRFKQELGGSFVYDWVVAQILACNTDECLLWPYYVSPNGYARVKNPSTKKNETIHRLAFFITHNRMPNPLARHTCDVRHCFNPRHIIEGTNADNSMDTVIRNRQSKGAGRWNAKLTDDLVRKIRAESHTKAQAQLASQYGMSQSQISDIIRGKWWKHI